jgi:hypothetical protein
MNQATQRLRHLALLAKCLRRCVAWFMNMVGSKCSEVDFSLEVSTLCVALDI